MLHELHARRMPQATPHRATHAAQSAHRDHVQHRTAYTVTHTHGTRRARTRASTPDAYTLHSARFTHRTLSIHTTVHRGRNESNDMLCGGGKLYVRR